MPRRARRWEPGAIHHVVARAHRGSPFFAADSDREFVFDRAKRACEETDATLLAGAVLSNHYHFVVLCAREPGPTLARLNTSVALRVVSYRGERGAVFQGRFFSDTCKDDADVLARLAYVVGNPVHHQVVPTIAALAAHPWSTLGELLGTSDTRWSAGEVALSLLDPDPARAQEILVAYLERRALEWASDGGDPNEDRELVLAGDATATGRPSPALPNGGAPRAAPMPRLAPRDAALRNVLRREGWTPASLLSPACAATRADPRRVRAGDQTKAEAAARAIVAYVACDVVGETMVSVAPDLGVGPTALVRARPRGRRCLAKLGITPERILLQSRLVG